MFEQLISRANGRIEAHDNGTITGYAIVYYNGSPGTEYQLGPDTFERIERGAAKNAIRDGIIATREHDNKLILGRSPETLTLWEDEHGIGYTIKLDLDTTMGRDAYNLVRSKRLQGSSFKAYVTPSYSRDGNKNVKLVRAFKRLDEISIVAEPAYEGTTAVVRSIADECRRLEETESRILIARKLLHVPT